MSKSLIVLWIVLIVVSIGIFITPGDNIEIKTGNIETCENFDSKAFLENGGSQTPRGMDEIKQELSRLNWLCVGGNNRD